MKRTAEQVRKEFPICTKVADEFREIFGPGVKIRYMKEDGKEMGRQDEGHSVPAMQMFAMGADAYLMKAPEPKPLRWEEQWERMEDHDE